MDPGSQAALQLANSEAGQFAGKATVVIIVICIISCCLACCSSMSNIAGLCASGNKLVTKFTLNGISVDCCCLCCGILLPPLLLPVIIFICARYMLMFSGQCKKLNRSLTRSSSDKKKSEKK